ncbi:MAG: rRNA m(5)U939 methyltransferase [Bacteroidetes bacterium]|jgi:23S rRNA (uracil1939-C5)-methyltransferase|nr:rRNA m(5)U939 methyltransferase [Bacteroidota bacterium]
MRANNKKPLPVLENISVTDASSDGQSIARTDEYVIFIKGAVPGDVVDLQITRKKSKYREANTIAVKHASEKRTDPVCKHFGTCGGCKWQNMSYEWQLFYKQKQVTDALTRLAKIELPEIQQIYPSQKVYFYRNKLEFTFSNKKWLTLEQINDKDLSFGEEAGEISRNALGFHIPGMFDKILDIDTCYLQEEPSNAIRNEIKNYALENKLTFFDIREQLGLLRNIIIRSTSTGEWMLIFSFFYNDKEVIQKLMDHISEKFPQITSLQYVINSKKNDTISDLDIILYKGNDSIYENMEGLKFKIGPKSFYQTNSEQAYELYKITRELAAIKNTDVVYDLYTGTGTIANFVAHQAKKVVGVEYIPAAIEDAKINSTINNITNTVFYAGDMKDVLNDAFIISNGRPDVIITDPPRAGMHDDVTNKILEIGPERIVYVSCNPATQARDLQLLDAKYKVTKVQPVDMFPQTHHVENVVLLELRNLN